MSKRVPGPPTDHSSPTIDSSAPPVAHGKSGVPGKTILGSNTLSAPLDYRICNHCGKPILKSNFTAHLDLCLSKKDKPSHVKYLRKSGTGKQTRKRQSTPVLSESPSQTPAPDMAEAATPGETPEKDRKKVTKKRKLNQGDGGAPDLALTAPKAKKKKPKSTPKVKGPVDVERQCGVPLPNGGFCARSLTCKTHSMGAKRAVPGRSAPYDVLLANYQRKNQVKLASLSTAQQLASENEKHGVALTEEEEIQQVLDGLNRSKPYPLEPPKVIVPTSVRTRFFRMREMFSSALLPRVNAGNPALFGGIISRAAFIDANNPSVITFRHRPTVSQHQAAQAQAAQHQAAQAAQAAQHQAAQAQAQAQAHAQAAQAQAAHAQGMMNTQNPM